jgi:hypothetical protein
MAKLPFQDMIYKKIGDFTTKDYAVIALVSAALLVMELLMAAVGGTLPMIIFVCLVDAVFTVLMVLILKKFGSVILFALLSATIALPTPAYGIAGLAKYPTLLSAAILMEIMLYIFQKRERLACMIGGAGLVIGEFLSFYAVATYLGLPNAIGGMLGIFIVMGFVIGSIGGYSGYLIYKRIENKPLIRSFGN